MPYQKTDALGLWEDLGVVDAEVLSWLKFSRSAVWGNSTFRVTFLGNLAEVETFCWIRQQFPTGAVTPAIRYYPKEEPQLIELPIPKDLFARNVTQREIEVKQSTKYVRGMGFISYPLFRLKVEELAGG